MGLCGVAQIRHAGVSCPVLVLGNLDHFHPLRQGSGRQARVQLPPFTCPVLPSVNVFNLRKYALYPFVRNMVTVR